MTIKEQLMNDLKTAMKAGNEFEVSLLRLLQSAIHNKLIDKRAKGSTDMSEDEMMAVLQSEAKKRKEAAQIFEKGGRPDLAEKEKKELAALSKYLPAEISIEEVEKVVDRIFMNEKDHNFGALMKLAMNELKGKVDGQILSGIIKKKIEGTDAHKK